MFILIHFENLVREETERDKIYLKQTLCLIICGIPSYRGSLFNINKIFLKIIILNH